MNNYRIKVTLQGIEPPVWRRLELSAGSTLDELHDILQAAMGWEDAHMHLFIVGGREYGVTDPELGTTIGDERGAVLSELVHAGERFVYVYDFGDDWGHEIVVESDVSPRAPAEKLPCCTAGARACPPEDCGGPPGYAMLLEALAHPDAPGNAERLAWLGEEFDPEAFDPESVNKLLG